MAPFQPRAGRVIAGVAGLHHAAGEAVGAQSAGRAVVVCMGRSLPGRAPTSIGGLPYPSPLSGTDSGSASTSARL